MWKRAIAVAVVLALFAGVWSWRASRQQVESTKRSTAGVADRQASRAGLRGSDGGALQSGSAAPADTDGRMSESDPAALEGRPDPDVSSEAEALSSLLTEEASQSQ